MHGIAFGAQNVSQEKRGDNFAQNKPVNRQWVTQAITSRRNPCGFEEVLRSNEYILVKKELWN